MSTLDHIRDTFLDFCTTEYALDESQLNVPYPSDMWTTQSWSYLLIKDFFNLISLIDDESIINKLLLKKRIDHFSYHGDLSRKIALFKKMSKVSDKFKVLIPEVGPCGFDVLIAKMSGFSEIVVYDCDEKFLSCCQKIWGDSISKYIKSESNTFPFKEFEEKGYLILSPDWFHGDLKSSNNVIKVDLDVNFKNHLKKIDNKLIYNFVDALKRIEN